MPRRTIHLPKSVDELIHRMARPGESYSATVARLVGCPEDTVYDVKIAVSEACTNAVLAHSNDDSPILLRVQEQPNKLIYEVSDAGPGGMSDG